MAKASQVKNSVKPGHGMVALPHFLSGGGETGALMRAKSWSDTLLGAPDESAILECGKQIAAGKKA